MELGQVVQTFVEHENRMYELHADVDAWNAPSECHGLIDDDSEFNEVVKELADEGWTIGKIQEEITKRGISTYWFWKQGLSYLIPTRKEEN